jgi:outer membrane lipoprotein-sorting protein
MTISCTACRLALASIIIPTLWGQSLDDVFARMDSTAQRFHAITADLMRTVHTAVINDNSVESGTIKVKREKARDTRMLVDLTKPDPKTVAIEETTVSVYYPMIKTVQVYDIKGKRSLVDRFLLLGFGATSTELKAEYEISWVGAETIDGKPTQHIQLIPKSPEVMQRLKKAELWISEPSGLPVRQRFVTSATGDFMLVDYSNVKFNPPLSDNSVKLNLPKEVLIQHPQL